jgi:MFS family permease
LPHADHEHRLERNVRLLMAFRALQMAMFPIAIVPLYWRDDLGFSVAEIFTIHALFGLFAACFEFPGGYLADRIGYRRAMGVASMFSLTGWLVLGAASGFGVVLVGELLLAVSLSLTSGTDAAILYESLDELGREAEFARRFGRNRSLGAIAEGSAALAAGVLYATWPPLPFFLQAGLWLVNGALVLALVEPRRAGGPTIPAGTRVRAILAFAAVRSPTLRASIVVVLVLGLTTFVPVWIFALYAENVGVSPAWIGPLWAGANYTVALGLWAADRVETTWGATGALWVTVGVITAGFLGMGLTSSAAGVFFYAGICLGRGINGPVLGHIQQRLIPSADRASLLSINSLLFRAAFFVIGPVVGAGVDAWGEHRVLLFTGAVSAPLAAASVVWLRFRLAADRAAQEDAPGRAPA